MSRSGSRSVSRLWFVVCGLWFVVCRCSLSLKLSKQTDHRLPRYYRALTHLFIVVCRSSFVVWPPFTYLKINTVPWSLFTRRFSLVAVVALVPSFVGHRPSSMPLLDLCFLFVVIVTVVAVVVAVNLSTAVNSSLPSTLLPR